MYRCSVCNKVSKPNEPLNRLINKRTKFYPIDEHHKSEAWGWEIAAEHKVCSNCFNMLAKNVNTVVHEDSFHGKVIVS